MIFFLVAAQLLLEGIQDIEIIDNDSEINKARNQQLYDDDVDDDDDKGEEIQWISYFIEKKWLLPFKNVRYWEVKVENLKIPL